MTVKKFWQIIEKAHRGSKGRMAIKRRLLRAALRKLPASEIRSFDQHFSDCQTKAYTWDLWAVAYIIGGGCSDDMFSDFRETLISYGRSTFEKVTKSPATVIGVGFNKKNAFYEGYKYVADEVYENKTGNDMPVRAKPHPKEPTGQQWREQELLNRFPELAKKYKFNDKTLSGISSISCSS